MLWYTYGMHSYGMQTYGMYTEILTVSTEISPEIFRRFFYFSEDFFIFHLKFFNDFFYLGT